MGELSRKSVLLTRYLLGDLPTAEQDRLEEEYFNDNELFLELLDAKDQLTSDYLNNQLEMADRERFERRFLTQPDCRRELEIDRLLHSSFSGHSLIQRRTSPAEKSSWWETFFLALRANLPLAGAAIAIVMIIGFIGLRSALRAPSGETYVNSGQTPLPSVAFAVVSLPLKSGRKRGPGITPTATIGPGTKTIELKLEVETETHEHYQANLFRVDEGNVQMFSDNALEADPAVEGARTVTWKIPAEKLPIGDYQVKLSGSNADSVASPIGDYDFRVRDR